MDIKDSSIDLNHLKSLVCQRLNIEQDQCIEIVQVKEHSNMNYVFRLNWLSGSIYLKVMPKNHPSIQVNVPRDRVMSEGYAISKFREYCGPALVIPEVLFIDREHFALAMSDVGHDRSVLLDIIDTQYPLFAEQACQFGMGLGMVQARSRGLKPFRPARQEAILRAIIFDGLLGPGAKKLFPEAWEDIKSEMNSHNETLVHFDLWGKNILVKKNKPLAIVDFEGAMDSDPAIDIATVLAVAIIPAIKNPDLCSLCLQFCRDFIQSYRSKNIDEIWASAVLSRAYRYTGTLLAARVCGPFPYSMNDGTRKRLSELACSVTYNAPSSFTDFLNIVSGALAVNAVSKSIST